jgi:hypothetical protein
MAALRVEITTSSKYSAACARKRLRDDAAREAHIKASAIVSFSVSNLCKLL